MRGLRLNWSARIRDRIETAGMPRPATANTPGRQPPAPQPAVAGEGFVGVLGTTGVKPARRSEHGTDGVSVDPKDRAQQARHRESFEKSGLSRASILAPGFTPYAGRTKTSIDPRAACSRRNASRMQRLIELRSVARLACRLVTSIPRRGGPSARGAWYIVNPENASRRPSRSRRSKSPVDAMRRSAPNLKRRGSARPDTRRETAAPRPRGACGPWPAVRAGRPDRLGSGFVQETRDAERAASSRAGRFASWIGQSGKSGVLERVPHDIVKSAWRPLETVDNSVPSR
jgi:hypothetical protein